jgi:hypothetical protein
VSARNVLVVMTEPLDPEQLASRLRAELRPDDETTIIASTELSPLEWLASDEDAAREEAGEVAAQGADAVPQPARAAVGDADPIQAVEDGLRVLPADLLVVARPEGADVDASAFELFDVPLVVLDVPAA